MDTHHQADAEQPEDRVVVTLSETLLTSLKTACAETAKVTLLGRIQGKHPGLKALTAWARATLHPSLSSLYLKANNHFEVSFSTPEGRIHALTQTELLCDKATINFASWKPHIDANTPQAQDRLNFPIWLQISDLSQILRGEKFLREVGEHIGQVIAIDNSEAYRTKLFGPRIRLLVHDLDKLPRTVAIPRLDGEGVVVHNLEFSGLPNQCGRCRSREHVVRHCPKRETKHQRSDAPDRSKPPAPPAVTPTMVNQTSLVDQTPTETREEQGRAEQTSVAGQEDTPRAPPDTPDDIATPETRQTTPQCPQTPLATQRKDKGKEVVPELLPNDTNFPQLSSPGNSSAPTTQQPETPSGFVWRRKLDQLPDKDKCKQTPNTESAPITRQGYRSGRLADDFWEVLEVPDTPLTPKKKLRVIPFISKNLSQEEYLIDKSKKTFKTITVVHIAELLGGVPWSTERVRNHIVSEVGQALHKVLIFNNQHTTPIHQWEQGSWYSQWTASPEGEHICTIYVNIAVPESKIKPRKGRAFGWRTIPSVIQEALAQPRTELIQDVANLGTHWQAMTGHQVPPPSFDTPTPTAGNPFSVLGEEETSS